MGIILKIAVQRYNVDRSKYQISIGMEKFDFKLSEGEDYGYIFEWDFEYPKEIHNTHKDLPPASEHYNNRLCTTLFH